MWRSHSRWTGAVCRWDVSGGHRMRDRWITWQKQRGSITISGMHFNHIPPTQAFFVSKVAEARDLRTHTHTPNFFLLITQVTAAQPPLIIALRQIISFIRHIMTCCHSDWLHIHGFKGVQPTRHTDTHKHPRRNNWRVNAKLIPRAREWQREYVCLDEARKAG